MSEYTAADLVATLVRVWLSGTPLNRITIRIECGDDYYNCEVGEDQVFINTDVKHAVLMLTTKR